MEPARGGTGGLVLSGGGRGGSRPPRSGAGPGAPAVTGEQGTLVNAGDAAADGEVQADPETLRRARQIAARLAVPRPRRDTSARRGAGELASVRYQGGSDDIDLDRTVEQLVEHPVPEEDDIIVRERVRTRRSVVLLVDVSGSMRGERIRTAAATVGALAAELDRDDLSVVAFWSDAAVLSRLGQHVPAQQLLEEMLRIPARGLTNSRSRFRWPRPSWPGCRPGTLAWCCCPTACTTPARTPARWPRACPGWTCSWTPRASRTRNWHASWPGWAADGCS